MLSPLEDHLRATLASGDPLETRLQRSVESIARAFGAVTCTFHEAVRGAQRLELRAQVGLPAAVLSVARTIPFGKGMAGICAARRQPVTVCNLQTDASGVVRPGARETQVEGALVVPLLCGQEVAGTLGVGKPQAHEYSDAEVRLLERSGEILLGAIHHQQYDQPQPT